MSHPAQSMYDFPPSLSDKVVSIQVTLDDEGESWGETKEFGLNLEFEFDSDGNRVVTEIQMLTVVDARMSDISYDIIISLSDLGYKLSDQAVNSLPETKKIN